MTDRFYPHWVAATAVLLVMTLLYAPFALAGRGEALALIYLFGPAYMLHQLEEHAGDRFRAYANRRVFGGREALSKATVLWVNLPGVWGLNLAALYAALGFGPGWGLAAPYLAVVNAVAHCGVALRFREYNPGLATALGLFFPLGFHALGAVPATLTQHLVGLGVAVAIHAAIVIPVLRQLRRAPAQQLAA
ncbi:HXXEE domain-containing protein [Rhodoblastus acidophilus]|uniref:HXXEE domain-containing protein n=1 Tax=Candidatus Rhodoblastus alkanivorans TaxID=2954117 RepID=A0ABS9ZA03_9HYPH|nr:HXXEE domain-containing protein [Candidatus Rhodoblastus alkanivorans]MCI4677986.1 HXXEE domain-containing protein [Candidatus Rhodoblastus alkanivorans]MCI4683881.1 HXXEE domain-containing protein [Candidatus Rhodoblastus alkanivorans]MDI4641199.1 HXXEE domain-containing protein [Rhodoblastus acidophilus]